MKKILLLRAMLLLAGVSLLAAGCATHREPGTPSQPVFTSGSEVVVTEAQPPPIVETVTITPRPGFVWIEGAYVWQGHWVWEPGHWEKPPHSSATWVKSRYELRNGRHIWVRGYWR